MANNPVQIDLVEAALIDLLTNAMPPAYAGLRVDVQSLGKSDFDDQGQLKQKGTPALRVVFDSASYGEARDTTRTVLSASLSFTVFCFHESIKSRAAERSKTLALVAAVTDQLAGSRLAMGGGKYTEPVLITGVNQAADALGPVDQVFAVSIRISGTAQFSGTNANFGAKA